MNVALPQKPSQITDGALADVSVLSGSSVLARVNTTQWGQTATVSVSLPGQTATLTFTVADIVTSTGTLKGTATPATVSASSGSTYSVTISYLFEPFEFGTVTLTAMANTTTQPTTRPNFVLKDSTGAVGGKGSLDFGGSVSIQVRSTAQGKIYTIEADSFEEGQFTYTPAPSQTVTVTTGQTTTYQVQYRAKMIEYLTVNFQVSGMPTGKSGALQVSNGKHDYSVAISADGSYMIQQVVKDGSTYAITVSQSISGYKFTITPSSFVANVASVSIAVVVSVNSHKQIVSGYWENWNPALPSKAGTGSTSQASYYKPSF